MSTKNEEELLEPSSLSTEDIFQRSDFAQTVASLVDNVVKVKTKNGSTYEGVFTLFTSNRDIIVVLNRQLDENDPFHSKVGVDNKLAIRSDDVVSISCVNVAIKETSDLSSSRQDVAGLWDERGFDSEWTVHDRRRGFVSYSEDLSAIDDKTSNLNPYAKPFIPMDSSVIPSLTTVVLPAYVVSSCSSPVDTTRTYGKIDVPQHNAASPPISAHSIINNQYLQYTSYGDDYDDKLYPWYDSQPMSAHDYQQYYPHLQYIQYFRRFY